MEQPKKLWSPGGIAGITIFFSFLVGGILYALNAERLGKIKSCWQIIGPLLIFAAVISGTLYFNTSPWSDKYADDIGKMTNIIFAAIFYFSQKEDFKKAIAEGTTKASFKLPILGGVVFIGLLIGLFFYLDKPVELNDSRTLETERISVQVPNNWAAEKTYEEYLLAELSNNEGDGVIYLDNLPYYNGINNIEVVKKEDPKILLLETFKSIEDDIKKNPAAGWTNFKIAEPVTEFNYKDYRAARGSFSVDENVLDRGADVNRTITRVLFFTETDMYNIVFAPHDTSTYEKEKPDFEKFLETLILK